MFSIALTGGIATGKSTFARHFLSLAPQTKLFDCDASVHELLTRPEVKAEITGAFGDVLAEDRSLDRAKLRALVFESDDRRRALEGILHPRVRAACAGAQLAASGEGAEFFMADVPLLYESGFPMPRELEVVVACTPAAQRSRLMARSAISGEMAERIIAAQWPIFDKMKCAGAVIWNGGVPGSLHRQTQCLLAWLREKSA